MGIGILENIEPEVTSAVTNLSVKCPLCKDTIKYLATRENGIASSRDLANELDSNKDSENYINLVYYLEGQNIVYTTSDSVGLSTFGQSIEKILTYLEERRK